MHPAPGSVRGHKPPYPIIDKDNTNIRYVLKSQVLAMRRKVRGE